MRRAGAASSNSLTGRMRGQQQPVAPATCTCWSLNGCRAVPVDVDQDDVGTKALASTSMQAARRL